MVEHRLPQFAAGWVGDVEQLGAAVHGHGEFLAREVSGADGGAGGQVTHPHRVPARAEVERPVQEVAVNRPG
jgi:hypothetical protein